MALIVGGVEAIGLLKDQLNLTGGVRDFIGSLNDNFSTLGFVIIGVFIFSWIGSMIVYRIKGFDRLESTTPGFDLSVFGARTGSARGRAGEISSGLEAGVIPEAWGRGISPDHLGP